jgi:hypothetical protein
VPHDLVVEQDAVPPSMSRASAAIARALRVLCILASPATVGVSRPASARRPICRQYSCIAVRSASIETSRCWMIWKLASCAPN